MAVRRNDHATRPGASGLPDPFRSPCTRGELTLAVIAAALRHPDECFRSACKEVIDEAIGKRILESSVRAVEQAVGPHRSDLLEPAEFSDQELWAIAAIQRLSAAGGGGAKHELRVTIRDSLDLSGGLRFSGTVTCTRARRRDDEGTWNHPSSSALHLALLSDWVSKSTAGLSAPVLSESESGVAVLRIPGNETGYLGVRNEFHEQCGYPIPAAMRSWWFGTSEPSAKVVDAKLMPALIQTHARLLPDGPSLSAMGGVAGLGFDDVVIKFSSPEAMMRLSAASSVRGMMQLPLLRPWGWLVLGAGEDSIRFVRSAHAYVPFWAQLSVVPPIAVPEDILLALSRWVGPFAGSASIELLESIR